MASRRRGRGLLESRIARRERLEGTAAFTDEWFPQQRAFYDDRHPLVAAICGRRAGKTRGGSRHFIRLARSIPGARLLYLNETRGEAERLAWYGIQNDGMAALVKKYKLNAELNSSDLSIYFPDNDSWIWLRGAKDEHEVRKALGGAYHEVWWDEAQKIPSKLTSTIKEVFMPALLDFGGRFRMTGTPVRNMAGLFFDATRPDERRNAQWSSHHWTLLDNPHFGDTHDERWERGVIALQNLYGGPDAAPIDSPIMQRELFGRWVREDAAYVYAVHKVPRSRLLYAPARMRPDGFPDVAAALRDLPFNWADAQFALGVDIGWFPDPFAMTMWAWHGRNPRLYEVFSWKKNYLTSDEQCSAIKAIREVVNVGLIVADASNPAKPTVKGWSKEWIERYQQPILEAEKHHKHGAIDILNNDILGRDLEGNSRIGLRDGGSLHEEMSHLQWSGVASATGRLVEDPTLANDTCFVAGTMVRSELGDVPVESIERGDMVWTRDGLRVVVDAGATGVHDTWKLEHERGVLVGTGNHPIMTCRGWVQLQHLTPDDTLTAWESTANHSSSTTWESVSDGIPRVLGETSASTGQRSADYPFTGSNGRNSEAGYRPEWSCITGTATRSTTDSRTSNCKPYPSICQSTAGSPSALPHRESTSSLPGSPPPHGIPRRMESNGIESTGGASWRRVLSMIAVAWSVGARFVRRLLARWSVAASATQSSDANQASTTSGFAARGVACGSGGTNTRGPVTAQSRVLRVQRTQHAELVYNLTVDGLPEYFAGGVLVHNCDAGLYAHRHSYSYRWRPPEDNPKYGTPAWVKAETTALEEHATYAQDDIEENDSYGAYH